jgi:origin recognition complex subunit 3
MPDTVILCKLHQEYGRLINLHDWLVAFASVVSPADPEPSRSVQARFVQGVLELQLLGYVKKTGRRADHVARLTWGQV